MGYLGGPGSCPPGFYWNAQTAQCESIESIGVPPIFDTSGGPPICPPGYFFDPINNVCIPNPVVVVPPPTTPPVTPPKPSSGPTLTVPRPTRPPPGTAPTFPPTAPINVYGAPPPTIIPPFIPATGPTVSTTTTSGTTVVPSIGLTPVIVNVDQSVSLADNSAANAVQNVADAVYAALQQAAGLAGGGLQSVTNDITGSLTSLTGALDTGIQQAYGSITDVLQGIKTGIGQTLGGIGGTIGADLVNALNPAVIALAGIAATISRQIGGLAGAIGQAVAAIIPTILAAISNPIGAITGVLGQIEQVLTGQIAGITTQVGTIATTLGGLGTTLDGVLLHYEAWAAPFVESQTGYPDGGSLHHDLSQIVAAIAGAINAIASDVVVRASDRLALPCGGPTIDDLMKNPAPVFDLTKSIWDNIQTLANAVFLNISKIWPIVGKYVTSAGQKVNAECPQGQLPMSSLIEAVFRGFIPYADAQAEALRQDIDPSRFKILHDNAMQQFAVSQLVEAKYRGIVTDADYTVALEQQGFTDSQIQALTALGINRLPLDLLWELRRRQLIDDPTLKTALAALQYDSIQQDALLRLTFRPPNVQDAIDGTASQAALQQLGLGGLASSDTVPEYVSVAGQNEGLDAETTALRWGAHWNVGSIGSYITLYFRGLISIDTLNAVMAKNYIPQELVATLITAARPLIQYRTISNMLRIGQIDVQTAGNMLLQHGYTPGDAQLLISYAQRPGAAKNAQAAKTLHAVSLGIAKREFIDGAISENDYYQILLEHGYTVEGANAEIAVEKANQAMIVRKENAQLVVDEYGAGLINEQTALAQLAVLGLTVYEIAKYTHKIRAFRVKAAKHPSEAELNDFRKNGIITDDVYTQQLELLGYSQQVAGWFVQWRTTSTTAPASTTSVISPPTTGGTGGSTTVTP